MLKSDEEGRGHGERAEVAESELGLKILISLRKMIRAVDLYSRKLAGEHNITGPQLICLKTVAARGPISVTEIGKAMNLSPSNVVGILDRLEERGLIERQRGTTDRRLLHVTATDAGRETAARIPWPLSVPLDKALRRMTAEEKRALASSFERLVSLMGIKDLDSGPLMEIGRIRKTTDDA